MNNVIDRYTVVLVDKRHNTLTSPRESLDSIPRGLYSIHHDCWSKCLDNLRRGLLQITPTTAGVSAGLVRTATHRIGGV